MSKPDYEQIKIAIQVSTDEVVSAELIKIIERTEKLEKAFEIAKELRFYCLGSDCSTQNIIKKWDEIVKEVEDE